MIEKAVKLLSDKDKRLKLIFILGIAGIILMVLPDFLPGKKNSAAGKTDPGQAEQQTLGETEQYRKELESRLEEVISGISGAGRTKVMINVSATKEYVYAEKSDLDRSRRSDSETLRRQEEPASGKEGALLRKVMVPEVSGAAVICDGASDPVTRERVMETASAILGLPSSRISVQPMGN